MNSDKIKETILNKRNFEAERLFLLSRLKDQRYTMTTKQLLQDSRKRRTIL